MSWRVSASQLRKIPAFSDLPERLLIDMAQTAAAHVLKAGEVLLHQGEPLEYFYAVQGGALNLINYTADGDAIALKLYGPGDVFGLLAISGVYPHPTAITALTDSVLIGIHGQDVRRLIARSPELALIIIDLLTAHVHEGHARVRNMATRRVDQRVAQFMLKLVEKFGQPTADGMLIDLPITQRELAGFVNTTLETINRTLTAWAKQDIVRIAHKRIEITDLPALQALAESLTLEHA